MFDPPFPISHLQKGERDRIQSGDLNPHEREKISRGENPWSKAAPEPDVSIHPLTFLPVVDAPGQFAVGIKPNPTTESRATKTDAEEAVKSPPEPQPQPARKRTQKRAKTRFSWIHSVPVWKELGHWLKWASVCVGGAITATGFGEYAVAIGLLAVCLGCCIAQIHVWQTERHGLWKLCLVFVSIGLIGYGAVVVMDQKGDKRWGVLWPKITNRKLKEQATVVAPLNMTFVNPANVQWRITNESSTIISRDVTYWFGLISFEQQLLHGNKPIDPVQIPVAKIDFINPKDSAGALIFNRELGIKTGERLFGVATFNCPGCTEQSYWLYIQHGQVAWFARMQGSSRGLKIPMGKIVLNPEVELEKLVPSSQRTPVVDEVRN